MRNAAPGPTNTTDLHRVARGVLNLFMLKIRQLFSVCAQRCGGQHFVMSAIDGILSEIP